MPLFLLGLIVLIGILIYAVYQYMRVNGTEFPDPDKLRERRSKPQPVKTDKTDGKDSDDKVLYFPVGKNPSGSDPTDPNKHSD